MTKEMLFSLAGVLREDNIIIITQGIVLRAVPVASSSSRTSAPRAAVSQSPTFIRAWD